MTFDQKYSPGAKYSLIATILQTNGEDIEYFREAESLEVLKDKIEELETLIKKLYIFKPVTEF